MALDKDDPDKLRKEAHTAEGQFTCITLRLLPLPGAARGMNMTLIAGACKRNEMNGDGFEDRLHR